MTNSLVGDHQVAVVDVDGELEVEKSGFLTFQLVYCIIILVGKNHEHPITLSIKFPNPRQVTL